MTLLAPSFSLDHVQHVVLEDMSWEFYEHLLEEIGVRELWRFDGKRLDVLHLNAKGKYIRRARSLALPFLPMAEFAKYVLRLKDKDQIRVLREFRNWLAKLPS
jgi:hypothetical protein